METEGFRAAVEFALGSKASGHGLWARRVVEVLERNMSAGAIRWGIAALVEESDYSRCNKCMEWLQQLALMVSNPESSDATTCEVVAQEIWYFEPPADNIQRAVSRLYFSWSRFLACDGPAYLMEVSRAMSVYSHSPTELGKVLDRPFFRAIDVAGRLLQGLSL